MHAMHPLKSLVFWLAVSSVGAHAATLAEITNRVLARSPEVQAQISAYHAWQKTSPAPTGEQRIRLNLLAYAGQTNLEAPPEYNPRGVALELHQLLFDVEAINHDVQQQGPGKAVRYYTLLQSTDDAAQQAANAYLSVQHLQHRVDLAQASWTAQRDLYEQIKVGNQTGTHSRKELDEALDALKRAQSDWLVETSRLQDVASRFERLTGEAPPLLAEAPILEAWLPTDYAGLLVAVQGNPGFQSSLANLRAALMETDIRRIGAAPFPAINTSPTRRTGFQADYTPEIAQAIRQEDAEHADLDARLERAARRYDTALTARDKACHNVLQSASAAFARVGELHQQRQDLLTQETTASQTRATARTAFASGQRPLSDLLAAETALYQSHLASIDNLFNLRFAEYQVLATIHRLLPALGLAPKQTGPLFPDSEPPGVSMQCEQ
jgi:outer membrane protein, adhesin transport system